MVLRKEELVLNSKEIDGVVTSPTTCNADFFFSPLAFHSMRNMQDAIVMAKPIATRRAQVVGRLKVTRTTVIVIIAKLLEKDNANEVYLEQMPNGRVTQYYTAVIWFFLSKK